MQTSFDLAPLFFGSFSFANSHEKYALKFWIFFLVSVEKLVLSFLTSSIMKEGTGMQILYMLHKFCNFKNQHFSSLNVYIQYCNQLA